MHLKNSSPVCAHLSDRCHSLCPQLDRTIWPHLALNTGNYREHETQNNKMYN